MSSIPQVSPSVLSSRQPTRTNSNSREPLPDSLRVPKSRILMVGQTTSWGAPLRSTLRNLGCLTCFAASLRVTAGYVRKGAYALVLLDSTVPPGLRKQLVSGLAESGTSLYQLFPVENGCWWLPVLVLGEDCFGSPGFRTKELAEEFARVLGNRH
jgi:hypothetical protein